MDFQPEIIIQARHRQSRDVGGTWYCASCKSWVNGTESYAVAIMPIISGGMETRTSPLLVKANRKHLEPFFW